MKRILLFFLILQLNTYAQIKAGTVEYKVSPVENGSGLDKLYEGLGINYLDKIKKLSFELRFNTQQSNFDLAKEFQDDMSDEAILAKVKLGFEGAFFQTNDSVYVDMSSSIFLGKKLIVKKALQKQWVLTNESKKIDDFLCYKATLEIVRTYEQNIFKQTIVAWYCPKIPILFGPMGYGGLPGLIIELQTKDAMFGVTKLTLNNVEDSSISIPNKSIKTISEKEFEEMMIKYSNNKLDKN